MIHDVGPLLYHFTRSGTACWQSSCHQTSDWCHGGSVTRTSGISSGDRICCGGCCEGSHVRRVIWFDVWTDASARCYVWSDIWSDVWSDVRSDVWSGVRSGVRVD